MRSVFCEKAIESLTLAISGSLQEGKVPAVLSDSHVLVCVLSWTWNSLRLWASWRVIQRVIHFVHLVACCTQTERVEVCLRQRLSLDLVEVAYDSVSSWVRRTYRYEETRSNNNYTPFLQVNLHDRAWLPYVLQHFLAYRCDQFEELLFLSVFWSLWFDVISRDL